ncbi:MAG TPA: GTP-binding protein, partial [Methanomassiliicoccales archaeon]|nr:GTP-binding protein [Methanomassiliicoccales archaeon]
MTTRIAIIGGFLGAGKTTIINKIAKSLNDSGSNVALITNDQGEALVDTKYSSAMGNEVAEVLRGCFCCRFPDFMHSARALVGNRGPDVILAEPVGSCTDLLATVVMPLKVLYPKEFTVAPLIIMVDSERVVEKGFDAEKIGDYLRKHQILEAEYVVLSKVDKVTAEELDEIREIIKELNPNSQLITYSAMTGRGLDKVL